MNACGASVWYPTTKQAGLLLVGTQGSSALTGRCETFPDNPSFYDRHIAVMALAHLYIDGVADLVDPDALAKQVEFIVTQRDEAIRALPETARKGELRQLPEEDGLSLWNAHDPAARDSPGRESAPLGEDGPLAR
jgi:hypothetical protein